MVVKIARWTMAHRRIVVLAWLTAAIGVFAVSSAIGSKTANDLTLPGTGSQHAVDLLKARFPTQAGDADQIVFHARTGKLTDAANRAAIGSTLARVSHLPHVVGVASPYGAGSRAISPDDTIGFATVTFDRSADVVPDWAVNKVIATADAARSSTLQVELGGQAIEHAQSPSIGFATAVGIGAAIVILLISFGSFIAMGLPIVTALLGLGVGLGLIGLASRIMNMVDFASQLALMIGLGVGVDYALFIVMRFRENYRANGGDVQGAVERAMDTSGRAVLFAGTTVVIALLGMFALGVGILNGVAVAGAIGVVMVLGASVTLLPALLSVAGRRIGAVGGRRTAQAAATRPGFWLRWVAQVQRRPTLAAIAATGLMLALAAPALGLRLGSSDAGNDPSGHTTRRAYDLLATGFGRGFNGPLQLAVKLPKAGDTTALTQLTTRLRATHGVASVTTPRLNAAGDTAAIIVYPTTSPQSAQTSSLVTHLRGSVLPPIERATGATAYVGGPTAAAADFSHVLSRKLPLFIGIVIALSALLLLVVFRSLVIPLQAAVMNLLSIGASLGIVQLVFQRGWLGGLFRVHPGPIEAFIPVLAFAIVFGLSMDYEVFLVSRVHEAWQAHGDASAAVRDGVARAGRVITAAAAVMVAVFASFAISGSRVLELFGLALASAVFLDAFVIRLILLPAVLELLGRRTWTFPRWLDRRLPRVAIDAKPDRKPTPRSEPAFEVGS